MSGPPLDRLGPEAGFNAGMAEGRRRGREEMAIKVATAVREKLAPLLPPGYLQASIGERGITPPPGEATDETTLVDTSSLVLVVGDATVLVGVQARCVSTSERIRPRRWWTPKAIGEQRPTPRFLVRGDNERETAIIVALLRTITKEAPPTVRYAVRRAIGGRATRLEARRVVAAAREGARAHADHPDVADRLTKFADALEAELAVLPALHRIRRDDEG